jgi:hypothetical protein
MVNFLDMTITLLPSGRIKTRLYEKPLNLHLYLSPHSAHPPGLVSGLIHGMLYRILLLTTDCPDTHQDIRNFYSRLRNGGYARHQLLPLFQAAHKKITRCLRLPAPDITPRKNNKNCIFFHVPYNSLDPGR